MRTNLLVHFPRLRALIASLVAASCLGVVVDYLFLGARLTLQEDGLVEWTTALSFLLSGTIAAIALFTARTKPARLVAFVIGLCGLLGFLDEWSFGQRSRFAYTPYMFYGVPIDGVHDLFSLAAEAARAHFGTVGLIAVPCLAVAFASLAAWRYREGLRRMLITSVALRYFAGACVLVFGAAILDLDFSEWNAVYALEELLELSAAILLVGGAMAQILEIRAAAARARA